MTRSVSAGILLHRRGTGAGIGNGAGDGIGAAQHAGADREVWIAHMGGPFWARKDAAAWSIPKGEYGDGEDPFVVALREFEEEIGMPAPALEYELLGCFRQPSGKEVTVYVAEYSGELEWVASNTFELEWPRGSGRIRSFPEIDRAAWTSIADARVRLVPGQVSMLDALLAGLRN